VNRDDESPYSTSLSLSSSLNLTISTSREKTAGFVRVRMKVIQICKLVMLSEQGIGTIVVEVRGL
jgi:hypothetical protein